MPRKTIEVAYLVEKGNYFLAHSEDKQREMRLGFCSMIECALHKADVYAGYAHLDTAEVRREEYSEAWAKYRAIAEIRKANGGIVGYNNDFPQWEDYCKDDTRRVYMQKGQPYPTTVAANVKADS